MMLITLCTLLRILPRKITSIPLTIGEIFESYKEMRKTFDSYDKGAFMFARINFARKGMLRYATSTPEANQKAMKKL